MTKNKLKPTENESDDTLTDLTPGDAATLAEYLINGHNATQAWLSTHPDSSYPAAAVSGSRWLSKANIQAELSRRYKANLMSGDEVLYRLSEIARSSQKPFLKIDTDPDSPSFGFAYMNLADPEAQRNLHLVKKYKGKREREIRGYHNEVDDDGNKEKIAEEWEGEWIEVELHDPIAALKLIGQYHKLFTENAAPPVTLVIEGFDEALAKAYAKRNPKSKR